MSMQKKKKSVVMHYVVKETTTFVPQKEDIPITAPSDKKTPKKSSTCGLG